MYHPRCRCRFGVALDVGTRTQKGAKKEEAAELAPLTVSWILSVEVAETDESWTTHNEDWVMVDSGAGVSACPVDFAPECEDKSGSVKLRRRPH